MSTRSMHISSIHSHKNGTAWSGARSFSICFRRRSLAVRKTSSFSRMRSSREPIALESPGGDGPKPPEGGWATTPPTRRGRYGSAMDERLDLKPRLRGFSHQWAFFVFAGLAVFLIVLASGAREQAAAATFAAALVAMFGTSAVYHRVNWRSLAARMWWRRLDHAMIFVLIAGTYTPFGLLALEGAWRWSILSVVWAGALGAVVYARRRPDPVPAVFGYHEVFHACVIGAAACQYAVVAMLVGS